MYLDVLINPYISTDLHEYKPTNITLYIYIYTILWWSESAISSLKSELKCEIISEIIVYIYIIYNELLF